jgi:hypothetical protein
MATNMADETVSTTGPSAPDALAHATKEPNIKALIKEYDLAWSQDPDTDTRIVTAERIRYARWLPQNLDGLKHADEYEQYGREARPYDGAPDTRIFHADDVINSLVDVFYTAFWAAEIKVSGITAREINMDEAAEIRTVANWLKTGPLQEALVDDVERTAQIMCMLGWCVLHPTWRRDAQITTQTITMEMIQQLAQQAASSPQPSPGAGAPLSPAPASEGLLASAPGMIMDPEQEDAAVELFVIFFPDFNKKDARRVVKDLREKQEAEFQVTQETSVGPELAVLCPWYHFVMPIEATANPKYGRLGFVRVLIPEWAVDERAAAEQWDNEDFVEAVKKTKGRATPSETTVEDELDENQNLIELIYAFNWATNEKGAPGIFCTVFSRQISEGSGENKLAKAYGKHWLLDLGHKHSPFIHLLMEVTGWRPNDSRGVPDILATAQAEIKQQRDALFINSQLSNTPPLVKKGTQASKLPPEFGPFAIMNDAMGGGAYTPLLLTQGSKPEVAFKLYEMVKKEGEDYYGLPRVDTPPGRSQQKLQRFVKRWLSKWGEAFWQLVVLAYQNMEPEELAAIIGREPRLTASDMAKFKVTFSYDVRAGDGEWIERLVKWITQILSTGGATGMNMEKLLNLLLRYIDPGLYEEVANDPAGNKTKVFKETREQVNSVMLGNKPQVGVDLTEKDPTARMRMMFAQQIVNGNPQFKALLTPGHQNFSEEHAKNFKLLNDNWQHSYQETVLSKMQGKLGVKDVGQGEG